MARHAGLADPDQQAIGVAAGFAIFLIVTELVLPATEAPPIPKTNSVVDRGWRSVNERVVMMKSSAELTLRHPLLGVGPGQFGLHYAKTMAAHPHNSVLQLLAEYGLIAGGAGVALLIMLGEGKRRSTVISRVAK